MEKYQLHQKNTTQKDWSLLYLAVGLGGEVGELLNEIKKCERDNNGIIDEMTKEKLVLEMGDVLWYFTGIANKLDINFNQITESNIKKLTSKK